VPIDPSGDYEIAISTAAARPRNAIDACGVAWLPAGPAPQSALILRNMLPDPGFHQAIQDVKPGSEATTMGPYYPGGRYYATSGDFEATGCHPPASGPGAAQLASGTAVQGACIARRWFVLRVHRPRHARLRSITVYVNHHRVLVRRGRRINPVLDLGTRLSGHRRYVVEVVVRYSNGRTRATTRTYDGCSKSAPR
jgi:hypothetical protein